MRIRSLPLRVSLHPERQAADQRAGADCRQAAGHPDAAGQGQDRGAVLPQRSGNAAIDKDWSEF